MQRGPAKPPVGLIFDTDIGNGIDDVLALALLQGLAAKGEARLISTSVSKSNLKAAGFIEAVQGFYARAAMPPGAGNRGGFGGGGRGMAIGLSDKGKTPEDTPVLTVPLSKKNAEGQPMYPHDVKKMTDTAIVGAVMRNALTAQHDENAIIVVTGPATDLAELLAVPDGMQWIKSKCKLLVIQAGSFPGGEPDFNIKTDLAAARKVFAEWPTPIVVVGSEVGEAIKYPAASIENDYIWAGDHPVVDAYKAYQKMPYDAPTGAMAAVLYASKPEESPFKLSDPGTVTVGADGKVKFTPSADGKHRYLIVDPAQKEAVLKTYTEVASAKPPVRQARARGGFNFKNKKKDDADKKDNEEKKDDNN